MATTESRPDADAGGAVRSLARWHIVGRILAAIPANYVYTALATAFAARFLPLDPGPASVAATLASFLLFAILVTVAFFIRRVGRLWLFLVATGVPMALLLWRSLAAEGRL
ncbi:MAG: hypothetical protein AAF481_02490 [Acidobacteriota bacterium]